MFVINWQINGGENWEDYRGGTIRDTNSFLTDNSYTSDLKGKAKRFDDEESAVSFGKWWVGEYTENKMTPTTYREKGKLVLDYGSESKAFGSTRLVIRQYRPRS